MLLSDSGMEAVIGEESDLDRVVMVLMEDCVVARIF